MNNNYELEKELIRQNKKLRIHPFDARNYIHRGMTYFKLGRMVESLRDYNKAEELNPQLTPYLCQRGLSYYYLGKYAQGARQFEIDLSVNSQDVEETIWHFLCIAQLEGIKEAQQCLLPVRYDPRPVMRKIYQVFAGHYSPENLLLSEKTNTLRDNLYTHLYLGLFYEAHRGEIPILEVGKTIASNIEKSRFHINEAIKCEIDDYMWYLAKIHQQLRQTRVES